MLVVTKQFHSPITAGAAVKGKWVKIGTELIGAFAALGSHVENHPNLRRNCVRRAARPARVSAPQPRIARPLPAAIATPPAFSAKF